MHDSQGKGAQMSIAQKLHASMPFAAKTPGHRSNVLRADNMCRQLCCNWLVQASFYENLLLGNCKPGLSPGCGVVMEDASGDTLVNLLVGLADQPLNRLQFVF